MSRERRGEVRIGVTTDIAIASSETLQVEIPQAQNDLTAKFIRNRCGPAESDEVREAKALLAGLREQEAQAKAEYRCIVQYLNGV